MSMLIGQEKLISYLLEDFNKLPHTFILHGEVGCGKHSMCSAIADRYHMNMLDLSDNINLDTLTDLNDISQFTLVIVDMSKVSVKEQVVLLKSIEEPNPFLYIALIATDLRNLSVPVLSRCICYNFNPYSIDTLKQFKNVGDDNYYLIANTPGKVLKYEVSQIAEIKNIINIIQDKAAYSNLPSILAVTNQLDFGSGAGYNIDMFIDVLRQHTAWRYLHAEISADLYKLTGTLLANLAVPKTNKLQLIENHLLKLKLLSNGD